MAALARFDRVVLAMAGVKHVIVLIGINDIGNASDATAGIDEWLRRIWSAANASRVRAHAKDIASYAATLTPFSGTAFPNYDSAEKEGVRHQVNQ
jgi:lysophospholipase L1-like esterase